jgi:hypothetical protein
MLGGRRAFQGDSSADLMSAILNQDLPELSASNREISPVLDHIVHHGMEKDPQQRFQSAGDIAFQLNELSGIRTSAANQAIADEPHVAKTFRPWWTLLAAAAVALALLLIATWFLARCTAHPAPPSFQQLSFQQGYLDSARFLPEGQSFISPSRWGSDSIMALNTGRTDSQGFRSLGIAADSIASVSRSGELLVLENLRSLGPGYARAGTLATLALGGGAPRPVLDSIQFAN